MYHGTSLPHTHQIEQEGFIPNGIPYDMKDVLAICGAYEMVGWHGISGGGYVVIGIFTTGSTKSRVELKGTSFAYHYEYARNYATYPGGETIGNMMVAIQEFGQFVHDAHVRQQHVSYLRRRMRNPLPPEVKDKIEEHIEACGNQTLLQNSWRRLSAIREVYEDIVEGHKPVVYAVSAQAEWFDRAPGPLAIDLLTLVEIPPQHLLARVDYPNGAERVDVTLDQLEGFSRQTGIHRKETG